MSTDDNIQNGSGTEVDDFTGTETTGHTWDGIKELNTPLPRWWLWTFYATVIWGLAYTVAYPAWPLVSSATKGVLVYSTRGAVEQSISEANAAQSDKISRITELSLEDIKVDEDLLRYAVAGGKSAFLVNCSQCHGSGAAGGTIYPNLNDDDWIWGGTLEAIETTLKHGIRYSLDDETRVSEMPAFGADEVLGREEIRKTAEHVLALAGLDHDAALAAEGATLYEENCAACHGETGEGNHELGAPALNDAIWLYGGEREAIVSQISKPKQGVMPGWQSRLNPTTIKQLALYVHGLGGGESSAQ
jgi:cytochrome c oxidase cbb3-type subunit 3